MKDTTLTDRTLNINLRTNYDLENQFYMVMSKIQTQNNLTRLR